MNLNATISPANTGTVILYQGATFKKEFVWTFKDTETDEKKAVDLSNAQIQMQLRKSVAGDILVDFTEKGWVAITSPLEGKFEISIPAADTTLLDFGRGIFQIEIHFSDGVVVRIVEGYLMLSKEVVR